jgi:hypothetical protein
MSLGFEFSGWLGEIKSILAKKLLLKSAHYIDLNDVTIPTPRGTTQIDHVIISRYGIFVVESKNMRGWIFGNEDDPEWTKINKGHKLKFQNPLHQNQGHVRALSRLLGVHQDRMHSVVVFWGDCSLRTAMPPNVLTGGYTDYVRSKTRVLLNDADVKRIVAAIRAGMLPKTSATRRGHVGQLKERFGSTTTCARCGSSLVLRAAWSGSNAGNQFFGCSRYPMRRYVRKVDRLASA